MPEPLTGQLYEQIITIMRLHESDLANGYGEVYMPNALTRKYPSAAKELAWQYIYSLRINIHVIRALVLNEDIMCMTVLCSAM